MREKEFDEMRMKERKKEVGERIWKSENKKEKEIGEKNKLFL